MSKSRKKKSIKKKSSKKVTRTVPVSDRLARRWAELSGKKYKAGSGVPAALGTAIENMIALQAGPGGAVAAGPLIVVTARKVEGTGCEQRAEIAGFYSNQLAPGANCIGQAAVLAILNAAAAAECKATLDCPSKCPCNYVPRQALAAYSCQGGSEDGYLLQGTEVWNCFCFAQ